MAHVQPQFGMIAREYDTGRRGYAFDVMDHVCSLIRNSSKEACPFVLDLGCGTGISTRQLFSKGLHVLGCDKDEQMVEIARSYKDTISYFVRNSKDLNVYASQFNAVTAFGSFHWFTDQNSLVNISGVLKKGGVFVVVNKEDVGDFRKTFDESLEKVIGFIPEHAKMKYTPSQSLRENLFCSVGERTFEGYEQYSLEEILALCQSLNAWNAVPEHKRQRVLQELKMNFSANLTSGFYHRAIHTVVVNGFKQ